MSALYPSPASAIVARPRFRYEAARREDERKRKKTHPDQRFRVAESSEIVRTVVLLIIVCTAARILSRSIAFRFFLFDRSSFQRRRQRRRRIEITGRRIVRTPCPNVRDFIGCNESALFPGSTRRAALRYEKLRQDTRGVAFDRRFVNREKRWMCAKKR